MGIPSCITVFLFGCLFGCLLRIIIVEYEIRYKNV